MPRFVGTGFPIEHNMAWAEAYLRTKWHLDPSTPLVTLNMGRQVGERYAPFWGPGPTSTYIFIDPTVWPQQTIVTESSAVST